MNLGLNSGHELGLDLGLVSPDLGLEFGLNLGLDLRSVSHDLVT